MKSPQPNKELAESILKQIEKDRIEFLNQGLKPSAILLDSESFLSVRKLILEQMGCTSYVRITNDITYLGLPIKIVYNKSGMEFLDYLFEPDNALRLYKPNNCNSMDFLIKE